MNRFSVHKKLRDVIDSMNRQFFVAGGLLTQVQEHKLWRDVRCMSFTDYCERQLDISYTTAHRWIAIYTAFHGLKFDQHLLIGPTKMYMLIDRVDQDNVKDLLIWARDHNLTQCRRRFNRGAPRDRSIAFWVNAEEEETIMAAVYAGLEVGMGGTQGEALSNMLHGAPRELKRAS